MKILLIDDDPDVRETVAISFRLQWQDAEILTAATGEEAVCLFEDEQPNVVILDIALPDMSGFDVCRQIRSVSDVPVIMLTAKDDEMDKVKGLELGGDDYVTKPFSHLELFARIRAVLRRYEGTIIAGHTPPFTCADLTVDFDTKEVSMHSKPVKLTPTEYNLLVYLIKNAGHVLTHETLLRKVWGPEYRQEIDYLKVYIRRLREKLGDDAQNPRYILTERGIGYRFAAR